MPTRLTDRMGQVLIVVLSILGLTAGFTLLLAGTAPEAINEIRNAEGTLSELRAFFASLPVGFFTALLVAFCAALVILAQFIQAMYQLEPQDAWKLIWRILAGVYREPPLDPVMRVQEGRPDPDGPEILHDLGGPGHITVGHDNAVVLARGGKITRVEGSTQVRLEAFEKIWDTIDLRPQRRELRITANTRDGIPVTCRAEVRFRVQRGAPEESLPTAPPLNFTDDDRTTVLRLATNKVALAPGGERRVTDWMIFLTNGTFDGEVRNRIERYRLDELFDPDREGPSLLTLIEQELVAEMRKVGESRGVQIDQVHLTGISPDEELISEQWQALWRSSWQRDAAIEAAVAKAMHDSEIEKARAATLATMIAATVKSLRDHEEVDSSNLYLAVRLESLRVMRAMAQMDPMVQSAMFQQVDNLEHIINQVLGLPNPASTPPAVSTTPTSNT